MLDIHNLSVAYPDRTKAIDGLSFSCGSGENIALIGANGAGKTTLMLALTGVLPSDGDVTLGGLPLEKGTLRAFRKKLGLVFQNPDDQLFMPSVFEDIAFGLRNDGLSAEETEKRVDETLAALSAQHLRNRSPLKLSGGEKRIAAIAAVLALRPSMLLLDEPTAFLDLKARRTLIDIVRGLPQAKLIASHDLSFLAATCERTVLMKNGKIFADGRTDEILRDENSMRACDLETLAVYGGIV